MERRKFIKKIGSLSAAPLLLNGIPIRSMASVTDDLAGISGLTGITDRVLVVIQLFGGNDGLNTFIPINQYDQYKSKRPDIAIADTGLNAYTELDSTLSLDQQVGLNPSLISLKALYDDGLINIIQGVGYPQANKSHFKSTDLWMSGGDGNNSNGRLTNGWIGRYLKQNYPNVLGNPIDEMPDPLGIQLGDRKPALSFHTGDEYSVSLNLTGQDPNGFFENTSQLGGAFPNNIPNSDYGKDLNFIINTFKSTNSYAQRISEVFDAGSNSSTAYPNSSLAGQLKTVTRLIKGGSKTKVFFLRHGGAFDTHKSQVDDGSPHTGRHAGILKDLADSVKAFQEDLKNLSLDDRVMGVTLSEFGRKVVQNGNLGTDHGTLNAMMVFGKATEGGVTGQNIDISDNQLDTTGAPKNENMQHDYRQVYTTLLQDWLGASSTALENVAFNSFENQKVNIINSSFKVNEENYFDNVTSANIEKNNGITTNISPNPASDFVSIDVRTLGTSRINVTLLNLEGDTLKQQEIENEVAGTVVFDVRDIREGQYFIKIEGKKIIKTLKIMITK